MRQKIVLIGGFYGSGKSTLIHGLIDELGYGVNLDYDVIAEKVGAFDPAIMSQNPQIRKDIWDKYLPAAVDEAIGRGEKLILTAATFALRERRSNYLQLLDKYAESVDIYPLMIMLPMKDTIKRIKEGRIGKTHPINNETVNTYYRGTNQLFKKDDHSDLLLPTNRESIPLEYRIMLSQKTVNQEMLQHPELDGSTTQRWVVIPSNPTVSLLEEIMFGSVNPLEIRNSIESRHSTIEGSSLPSYYRK